MAAELRDLRDYKLESALKKLKRFGHTGAASATAAASWTEKGPSAPSSLSTSQLAKAVAPLRSSPLLLSAQPAPGGPGPQAGASRGEAGGEAGGGGAQQEVGGMEAAVCDESAARVAQALRDVLEAADHASGAEAAALAGECEAAVAARAVDLEGRQAAIGREKDEALARMELWRQRQTEAPRYEEVRASAR